MKFQWKRVGDIEHLYMDGVKVAAIGKDHNGDRCYWLDCKSLNIFNNIHYEVKRTSKAKFKEIVEKEVVKPANLKKLFNFYAHSRTVSIKRMSEISKDLEYAKHSIDILEKALKDAKK